MNHRIRETGGLVWFQPRMRVSYRPRATVGALASQYFHYGRWRRVVARTHSGTINLRYLAPPIAVTAIVLGLIAGIFWPPALVIPVGYVLAIIAGSVLTGRDLEPAALLRLPVVYAAMHLSWRTGFITSPKRLRKKHETVGLQDLLR